MNIYRRFLDSSLRFKILFGLLLSLVPMLVIMGISYTSARSNAVGTSERIIKLVNDSGAKEINGFIKAQQASAKTIIIESIISVSTLPLDITLSNTCSE